MTVRQFNKLGEELKEATLEPVDDLVSPLRAVKDEEELRRIRHACAIADAAFEQILPLVRPGVIERDLAIELEHFMKKRGAEKEAFDTIVASGPRSALPHGRASARRLEAGDFVTFDFGARWEGYNSDLTRTVVLGRASDEQRKVYMTVLGAQMAALGAIRAGAEAKQVDAVARDRIAAAGYGERFGHGLGHALGREVHDGGGMNSRSEMKLAAGMVLTVEPGIYINGWGGVRIEDDVVVTGEGCEILTHAPKELIELDC
jgi:Xaa-Pro aminopeptidase